MTWDETYCHMLLGIAEEKRGHAQRLFRCLTVSIRPLRAEELAEIFAVSFGRTDWTGLPTFFAALRPKNAEEAVISTCSSLISIVNREGRRVVEFSHFSARVSQGGQLTMGQSSLDIAEILLDSGAGVNAADNEGWTPLHAAARYGYRDAVELLLSSGATLDVRNKKQRTPLHLSCGYGKLYVSDYLIYRGSDVNSWDEYGFTPLHMASRYGHVDVVRLLLDHGADANTQRDELWSPLHLASTNGHLEIVKLLVESGASVDVKSVGFVGTL
jgi:hypothetical protein